MQQAMGREGLEPSPNGLKVRNARHYTSDPFYLANIGITRYPYLPTARPGLEPESTESKSAVLPLDDQANFTSIKLVYQAR